MTEQVSFIRLGLRHLEPGGVSEPALPIGRERDDGDRTGTNLPTARDHLGCPHLPPTTVAGGLRALLRSADPELPTILMGNVARASSANGSVASAVASQIWVLGTSLLGDHAPEDPYQSTAIDRTRGAAAVGTLRQSELLPVGTRWQVWLRWDDPDPTTSGEVLDMLKDWQPLIGRSASSGRGRCTVDELQHGTLDLRRDADLLTFLTLSGPELADHVATTKVDLPSRADGSKPALHRIECAIVDALHVGTGRRSARQGDQPEKNLLLRRGGQLVVPGTTLKGILRSRVEFILRSVGLPSCADGRCGACWPCVVFGYGGGQDRRSESVGARARIRVLDAPITGAVEAERIHVAINRLTGGAEERLLFTDEVVESGSYTIVIEDIGLDRDQRSLLAALLRLVAEDMTDGLVTIGRGGTRGYGRVRPHEDVGDRGLLPPLYEAQQMLARLVDSSRGVS